MADLLPGGAPRLWLPRTPSKRGYHTTFAQTAARAQQDASAGRACSRERWIDEVLVLYLCLSSARMQHSRMKQQQRLARRYKGES